MSTVTYRNGVATSVTPIMTATIHVATAAATILAGSDAASTKSDCVVLSLAAGYQSVDAENKALRAELEAARAGTIGVEHAAAMQEARKVIADLLQAGNEFFAEYDLGEGPDGVPVRKAMNVADHWLLLDVKACGERVKVLKGGAQ